MHSVKIKALSVNDAWQGRRYKSQKYTKFSNEMNLQLVLLNKPQVPDGPINIHYRFHISNMNTDVDNLIKAFQDVLFKWLEVDDRRIVNLIAGKVKCRKGEEKIEWDITAAKGGVITIR